MLPIHKLEQSGLSLNTFYYVHLCHRGEMGRISSRPFPLMGAEHSRDTVHGADEHRPPGDLGVVVFESHLLSFNSGTWALLEKKRLPWWLTQYRIFLLCGRPEFDEPPEMAMVIHSSILAWRIPWQMCLEGYSPWACKELDRQSKFHFTRKKRWGGLQGVWTGLDLRGSEPVRLLWTLWQVLTPHRHDKVQAPQSRLQ